MTEPTAPEPAMTDRPSPDRCGGSTPPGALRPGRGRSTPLRDALDELRIAVRGLLRSPDFTVVAVITLAVGIGTNTAVFSLVDAFFLSPLPYPEGDRLVLLWETERDSRARNTVAPGNYFAWKAAAGSFDGMAAFNISSATLTGDGRAERLPGSVVRPGFFDVLGVAPALGTGFSPEHAREGNHRVAVISHSLWRRRFAADPGVVGETVTLDGEPHTLLGVMPAGYRHPDPTLSFQDPAVWRPLVLDGLEENRDFHYLRVVARLRDGASVDGAREEMRGLAGRLAGAFPATNRGVGVLVRPLDDALLGSVRPVLAILLAAGLVVLLIVCANTSNLVLARQERRSREMAVRASLGAGRGRLVREALLEVTLVALAGGAAGIVTTAASLDLLRHLQGRYFTSVVEPELDVAVVAFTVLLALAAGALSGLLPAYRFSRPDLRGALSATPAVAGGSRGSRRIRGLLVTGQIALTATLLVTAGLLTRSLAELTSVPPGFEARNRLTFRVSLTGDRYSDRPSVLGFYRRLVRELDGLPGVRRAAIVSDLPFTSWNVWNHYRVPGRPFDPDDPPRAETRAVHPAYFRTMGIPLLEGESLPREVDPDGPRLAVISRRMAEEGWPGESAVGRRFGFGSAGDPPEEWTEYTVVGVVGNIRDDGYDAGPEALFYRSYRQAPRRGMTVVLRTGVPPTELAGPARRLVASLDPEVPVSDVRPLARVVAETVARPRAASAVSLGVSALALLLAAVGIFGLLSYTVSARTREIGVRTALGARGADVVALVLGRTTRLVGAGLAVGFVGALAASRLVSGLLFGVRPWDLPAFLAAALVLGGTALLAAWLPARRAARVDPMRALREE